MLTRILTALVLAPALVSLVLLGPLWGVAALLGLAGLISIDECIRMTTPEGPYRAGDRLVGGVCGAVVLLATAVWAELGMALGMGTAAVVGLSAVMMRFDDVQSAGRRALGILASIAYVGALFAIIQLFLHLGDPTARHALMLLFLTVWLGDTMAYFVGRAFGKHKLAPRVSPKKTWEGAAGGVLGSVGGAFLARELWFVDFTALDAIGIGLGAAVVEQWGDLAESLLKRATNTKDSGSILPGHGGMLDRMDGLIFAAVPVYAYLVLM